MTALVVLSTLAAGTVGALGRFLLSRVFPSRAGRLPIGILVANSVGCAIAGVLLALADRATLSPELKLILLTGFCGGLTTFSTWSVETIELIVGKRMGVAVLNLAFTLVLGIGAAAGCYLVFR